MSNPPSFTSFPDIEPSAATRTVENHSKSRKKKARDDHDKKRAKRDRSAERESDVRFFYSDRKGDPLNIQYNGLHRGDVPKYKLVNRILLVSLASGLLALEQIEGWRTRTLLASTPSRLLSHSNDTYKHEEEDGFLRLRRRRENDPSDGYLPITHTNADLSDSESSDSSDAGSSSGSDLYILDSHQATLKSLECEITADPTSVHAWLSLLSRALTTIPLLSKNAVRTRSEITISIISRAFGVHPANRTSRVLRLNYLKAGEEIWHKDKLDAEWEDALKTAGGIELWMEWLEWIVRTRNLVEVVEAARRIIDIFGSSEGEEMGKLRVFWRTAMAFKHAGFVERAIAMCQAQAELTFEVPQVLCGMPLPVLLDALVEFWDADVPRIGEPEARGWAHWASTGKQDQVYSYPAASSKESLSSSNDPFVRWAEDESHTDIHRIMPAHSLDNDDEDDPYSVIIFDDIRPLLLNLQSPRAKDAFRLVWLSILGLHVPGFERSLASSSDLSWDDRWSCSHFMRSEYINALFPSEGKRNLSSEAQAGVIIGRERQYESGFGPVKSWTYGVVGPLDRLFGSYGLWDKIDVQLVEIDTVRRVFRQLRLGSEDDWCWDTLALAFEVSVDIKGALKLSRSFLTTFRDSGPHWAAHAALERIRGCPNDARKVYQTILISSPSAARYFTTQLWCEWSEMEWLSGSNEQALSVVLRATGVEGQSREGISMLRAKRCLKDRVDATTSWKERSLWMKLAALLEILTSRDIEKALSIYDGFLSQHTSGSVAHESMTVTALILGYRYLLVLKNAGRPEYLRQRAENALGYYPNNSFVLAVFLEAERGQGIWGRVRRLLGDAAEKEKSVIQRIVDLWIPRWERGRWENEIERTRSGLAMAVESDRTRYSPVIWRLYLEFEIRAGELHRAKKLLFRAIGECPLVKDLYLLAFGPLRNVFNSQELSAFADTMAERGIRMRQGLDDVVLNWRGGQAIVQEDTTSDSEDEIMYDAQELRRLRPF